jgi:isopentenyl diphosphate isomerase/L-lactate dehydrogenase-like FMN-dependent dehydrogenase
MTVRYMRYYRLPDEEHSVSRRAQRIESHDDAHEMARRRLPRIVYEFVEGGSERGRALRSTVEAFDEVELIPRMGIFEQPELGTTVLGHPVSFPVLTAPAGGIRLIDPAGEAAVARATGAAGTIQVLSTMTGFSIEDVMASATGPVFFQLWYPGSVERAGELIDRVKAAGASALVLTIDSPIRIPRERSYRGRLPLGPTSVRRLRLAPDAIRRPRWLARYALDRDGRQMPMFRHENGEAMAMWDASKALAARTPTWDDVAELHDRWNGPLVIKGVLTADDARRAVAVGADAIVVSNHGGNFLDSAPPSLSMLGQCVDAVGDDVEVLLDSGVRRGSDVVKAVALGARAVLIGRSYVYALAAAGEEGVRKILDLYRGDIHKTMMCIGCRSVAELDRSYIRAPKGW